MVTLLIKNQPKKYVSFMPHDFHQNEPFEILQFFVVNIFFKIVKVFCMSCMMSLNHF
jgi:hypothetical protein